jgi:hypothetical protein
VPILRRAVPAAPVLLVLALGACSSGSNSAASSTPTTAATTSTTTLDVATTAVPASTAVGAPVPIGSETTTIAPGVGETSAPIYTTVVTTGPGESTTSTAGGSSTSGASTSEPTTSPPNGPGSSATTTATTSTTVAGPNAGTPFCQFEAEVEDASDTSVDDAAFLAALGRLSPRMDAWVTSAPNDEQRQAATVMQQATKASIDAGDLDPFDADNATEALLTIQLFCGSTR